MSNDYREATFSESAFVLSRASLMDRFQSLRHWPSHVGWPTPNASLHQWTRNACGGGRTIADLAQGPACGLKRIPSSLPNFLWFRPAVSPAEMALADRARHWSQFSGSQHITSPARNPHHQIPADNRGLSSSRPATPGESVRLDGKTRQRLVRVYSMSPSQQHHEIAPGECCSRAVRRFCTRLPGSERTMVNGIAPKVPQRSTPAR